MSRVAILDFGAQYAKVIDRRVRELCIESDILSSITPASALAQYDAIILSGGPQSVYDKNAPHYDPSIFTLKKPILGICYGMQLMCQAMGGKVVQGNRREDGETSIGIDNNCLLFEGLNDTQQVLMSHGDIVERAPKGFLEIGYSQGVIAAMEHPLLSYYGVQFHPEVDLTLNGKVMLKNFLYDIAQLKPTYTMTNRIETAIKEIKETVRGKNVLVLVSGGVDSAVTAALLLKALGPKQVFALHVDSGFMRKNESGLVEESLKNLGLAHFKVVAAQEEFLNASTIIDTIQTAKLNEVIQPEIKRKIIGDTFMKIVDKEISSWNLDTRTFLAQGTLRPDLIESASTLASAKADTIKTHHNDSALVREKRRQGLVIEPNKDWHKDEVREVGRRLGLPSKVVDRHPFPGPGLAVRILCSDVIGEVVLTQTLRAVQEIAKEFELKAVVLPLKSVGVQGDGRSYRFVAALKSRLVWDVLKQLALKIPREVNEVNRVVVEVGAKEGDSYLHANRLSVDNVGLLQSCDHVVSEELKREKILHKFAQVPVILLPYGSNESPFSIVIRPFITNDFMTGRAAVIGEEFPQPILQTIANRLLLFDEIFAVYYDLTSKPPGTVEWE